MIVTDYFVYIHTSRTGGTFLNRLIMNQVSGAQMIQYHGHLGDLPEQFAHLPVIGFVRDPYDWYVSMYWDYKRKGQYVFQVLSEHGRLDFQATVTRFLNLGDGSDKNKTLLEKLVNTAPTAINAQKPARRELPGLKSVHFERYPKGIGYYSWLFRLMYESEREHDIRIGRFEQLRPDALRLFEETGTPISDRIDAYLRQAKPLNASPRPRSGVCAYTAELEGLVAERDAFLIDRFGYER